MTMRWYSAGAWAVSIPFRLTPVGVKTKMREEPLPAEFFHSLLAKQFRREIDEVAAPNGP